MDRCRDWHMRRRDVPARALDRRTTLPGFGAPPSVGRLFDLFLVQCAPLAGAVRSLGMVCQPAKVSWTVVSTGTAASGNQQELSLVARQPVVVPHPDRVGGGGECS